MPPFIIVMPSLIIFLIVWIALVMSLWDYIR